MLSRVGLRQLVVMLVLGSLLVIAGNMFWASSSLHQQALQEHDAQRQQSFARQLASKLELRLSKESLGEILGSVVMDEQQHIRVVDAAGQLLYPDGDSLTVAQQQYLALHQHAEKVTVILDDRGIRQVTNVVAVPGTTWMLVVQSPVADDSGASFLFTDSLVYSLPAGLLLMVLAWLAGGRLARPFRLLAAQARSLHKPGSAIAIQAVQASSKEAAEMKQGLLLGARQTGSELGLDNREQVDPLTGLSTPDILPELMANISRGDMSFAAVALAVDDYDQLQEHFAPHLRDQALKQLAQLVLQHSRELDISVRMAEEVYLLLLPQCPAVIAQRIAERLRSKVQDSVFAGVGHMTISAGVAVSGAGSQDPLGTLKQAQQLLISARKEGQNRVHVMPG